MSLTTPAILLFGLQCLHDQKASTHHSNFTSFSFPITLLSSHSWLSVPPMWHTFFCLWAFAFAVTSACDILPLHPHLCKILLNLQLSTLMYFIHLFTYLKNVFECLLWHYAFFRKSFLTYSVITHCFNCLDSFVSSSKLGTIKAKTVPYFSY